MPLMTLEKALEILKADLLEPGSVDKLDFQDAEQLSIEAMKRLQFLRSQLKVLSTMSLPREAE